MLLMLVFLLLLLLLLLLLADGNPGGEVSPLVAVVNESIEYSGVFLLRKGGRGVLVEGILVLRLREEDRFFNSLDTRSFSSCC